MILEGHILCWNEADLVPFVMDYWKKAGVDKLYVYDNGSTDGTLDLLANYDFVEVIPFDSNGKTDEYRLTQLRNSMWVRSKGTADWIIICDFDEVPYCTNGNLKEFLSKKNAGLRTVMHQLVCKEFPQYNGRLMHTLDGMRYWDKDTHMNKALTFPAKNLRSINFALGAHTCHPEGVSIENYPAEFCFFHLKHLGKDYVVSKSQKIYDNMREDIKREGKTCWHYKKYVDEYDSIFADIWNNSYEHNIL